MPFPITKSRHMPYRIVAASDASAESKQKAHYICDGSNDYEEIEQAIDDLPEDGGIIFLTEGHFNVTSSHVILLDKNLQLIGSGQNATFITYNMGGYYCAFIRLNASDINLSLKNFTYSNSASVGPRGFIGATTSADNNKIIYENIRTTNNASIEFIGKYPGSKNITLIARNCKVAGYRVSVGGAYGSTRIKACIVSDTIYDTTSISTNYYMQAETVVLNNIVALSSGSAIGYIQGMPYRVYISNVYVPSGKIISYVPNASIVNSFIDNCELRNATIYGLECNNMLLKDGTQYIYNSKINGLSIYSSANPHIVNCKLPSSFSGSEYIKTLGSIL